MNDNTEFCLRVLVISGLFWFIVDFCMHISDFLFSFILRITYKRTKNKALKKFIELYNPRLLDV